MIFKGLRFGMLLQLAVGPLCFLTLRTAADGGFWAGMRVTLAVTLVDALFIALSGAGAAAVLGRAKAAVRWGGCLVLCLFGVNIILGAFNIAFLPALQLSATQGGSPFWQGFVLTAANPLTIVFWGGVFTAQVVAHGYTKRQLVFFAAGCVSSTFLSLTLVAFLGSVLSGFLPEIAMQILNILVGVVLIGYGLKLLLQKEPVPQA
ncbi:MAG: LysE family transporter [Clostridiales bacterium]|nr:LysE family transporter [Clostridiales bacterium]